MSTKYLCRFMVALGLAASASAGTAGMGGGTCFNVTGIFADGATLSGTIDISTTALPNCLGPTGPLGTIIEADLVVSTAQTDFTTLMTQGPGMNGDYVGMFSNKTGGFLDLWIDASSLENYAGGDLCDMTGNCGNDATSYFINADPSLASGSITAPGTGAPEPATWMMLLAAPALVVTRRFRRAPVSST